MMEFLAANFNLPTIIVGAIVFGGVGWITWHSHKHGGCSGCSGFTYCVTPERIEGPLPLSHNGREGGAGQSFGPRPF